MLQDGHSAAPRLAGVQACQTGVGPRDQDRSHLQSAPSLQLGGAGTYDPARQVALYSTWGRVPMAAAAVAAARHHPDSQTHTLLTPTHTARQSGLFGVPVHGTRPRRAGLSQYTLSHTNYLFSLSQERQPDRGRDSARGVCCKCCVILPALPSPFLLLTLLLLQLSCKESREQGTGAKKETAKQGTERRTHANCQFNCEPHPGPLSNHHTHTHGLASKTETGLDGWSGCSTCETVS